MSGLGFLDGDEILRIARFRCTQIPQPTWKNSVYVNGGEADAVLIVTKTRKRREIRIIALSASDYAKDSKNLNFYFANNKFGGFFFSPIISKVNTNDEVLINKYLNEYSWSNYKTQVLVKKNNREDWKYDKNSWSGLNEHPNVGPFETKLENNWKLIQDPFDPNNVPPQVLDMDLINHWEEYKIWLKEQREKPPTPKEDPSPIVDPVKDVIIPIKLERDLTFNVEKNLTFISGDLDIGELTIVRKEDPSDPKFITPINTNSYPDDYEDIYSENAFEGEDEIGLMFDEIDGEVFSNSEFINDMKGYDPENPDDSLTTDSNSKYPISKDTDSNIKKILEIARSSGVTNSYSLAAILSICKKESGFIPQSEASYSKTSSTRIKKIFSRFRKYSDGEVNTIKKDYNRFFDIIYGGRYGNSPTEGSKYRGRGLNQITFKGNYILYKKLSGYDIVSDPDLLNKIEVACKCLVEFFKSGIGKAKSHIKSKYNFTDINSFTNLNDAMGAFYHANAGFGKSYSTIVADETGGRKKAFASVGPLYNTYLKNSKS